MCAGVCTSHLYPIEMSKSRTERKALEIPTTTERHWELKHKTHIPSSVANSVYNSLQIWQPWSPMVATNHCPIQCQPEPKVGINWFAFFLTSTFQLTLSKAIDRLQVKGTNFHDFYLEIGNGLVTSQWMYRQSPIFFLILLKHQLVSYCKYGNFYHF